MALFWFLTPVETSFGRIKYQIVNSSDFNICLIYYVPQSLSFMMESLEFSLGSVL